MSLRWVWSMLAFMIVVVVGAVMMVSINSIEQQTWESGERDQGSLLATLLADELKVPMMANSRAEVDTLIQLFMQRVPDVQVYLQWSNGEEEHFGDLATPAVVSGMKAFPSVAAPVAGAAQWYAVSVRYNTASLGALALYNPGKAWAGYADQIKWRLGGVAVLMALMTSLLAFVMGGRVRGQLRLLARASKRIASGDFSAHLPVRSTDEFGRAFHQFNQMVSALEQREKLHDLYGSYQRPQLVADEYDRNAHRMEKRKEVAVVAIDVVDYNGNGVAGSQEDALHTLNRCFTLFQHVAHEFGGHVDRFAGDGMVMIFNHPFDLKCYENQAAKAGMAIVEICKRLESEGGSHVRFRVGFALGEVMIGYLGVGRRKQLTIAGAPVALAIQLAGIVEADGLVALQGTMLALGHGFRPKELGSRILPDGSEVRCITVLPGELYVEQEVAAVVEKQFQQMAPAAGQYEDDDEGW
ncbi:HAMP domain-containing protein [Mariprofundus erugo]|uniref:adenylate/guanylate cyclase domain-containing protein n=1 Tax=Mariprofundus erugo TaxID=2528639 RepID=UPI0010FD5B99|nr:adenylate/guanylate cyclase domain-containing protein [Mariprofundus erugo]TLS74285.1 HAMP domain-containing protein [Mariprofundus erugo]